mmetsp:Transcript_2713/g.4684  ORF Transcript_2713/g.4684 Transcript_2713/m.4684 type:complete len:213 (+) Transcript_2713:49-687(+)
MEEDFGRARVYNQQGDSAEAVGEAIDCCPVNCIHYVSIEDLVTLERERLGVEVTFNNYGHFKQALVLSGGESGSASATKAKFYDNAGTRCNNCPSRGCAQCPMFGVGENPIYLERKAAREQRRRQSGKAEQEEKDKARRSLIDTIYSDSSPDLGGSSAPLKAAGSAEVRQVLDVEVKEVLDTLFSESFDETAIEGSNVLSGLSPFEDEEQGR